MRSAAWPEPPSDLMNSDSRSSLPVERKRAYKPATSFWQMAPLVEFQYVKTGSPSSAERRSMTGCVRSMRMGGWATPRLREDDTALDFLGIVGWLCSIVAKC